MKKDFLKELMTEGILADGAIGTEIYARGIFINRCFDALNFSNPEIIRDIHRSYIDAGARMIETNTFTANRLALAAHGLEDQVADINRAGVKLAQAVAGDKAYVAGSVGPVSWAKRDETLFPEEMHNVFREQMTALVDGGVDLLIIETFTNLDELKHALDVAREVTDKPIITSVSLKYIGEGEFAGLQPEDVRLVDLYRGARLFLFPTYVEGWTSPPLEAMACGTPVVASAASSVPETVGDAAPCVDPDDTEGWVEAATALLEDPAVRRDRIERGLARAARFPWDRHVDGMLDLYRSITTGAIGPKAAGANAESWLAGRGVGTT